MRAVVYDQFEAPPQVLTVDDPACPSTGVVIEVAATGVCRSDWHGWMGHDRDIVLPHVPGHEFAGTLTALGSDVDGWQIGDRVTVPFVCACGECASCLRGEQQVCDHQFQPGVTHWGSFAEFVSIDRAAVNLIRLPDAMSYETAAGLGCRFSTAYRAVTHHGRAAAGEWVVVHGCGGVGLSAVMIAAAQGARVIAVDVSADALELARAVGAAECVNATDYDVVTAVRDLTSGGAQISIDALGSVETFQNSIRCLGKRGRHVQVGLLLGADTMPPAPMAEVIAGELELIGSHGMAAHAFAPMLAEIADGTLAPQRLIGRRIGLSAAPAALATPDSGAGVTLVLPGLD
jgi:alcohol dehydrogenase